MPHKDPEAYKAYQAEYRKRNAARLKAYDRERDKQPARRAALNAAAERHRAAHPDAHRRYNRERAAREKALLAELKAGPCVDCGVRYPPCVMDFDHVRGTKLFHVNASSVGRRGFREELAKCELRCANCHRLRHNPQEAGPQ